MAGGSDSVMLCGGRGCVSSACWRQYPGRHQMLWRPEWDFSSLSLRPVSLLPLQLVLPEYSSHSLFCIMFLCAQEWLTLGLNVPLLFYHFWR